MHRVELKEGLRPYNYVLWHSVPNAPCGVERHILQYYRLSGKIVFLMHRVELKAKLEGWAYKGGGVVPNAPCGVESIHDSPPCIPYRACMFLMHRVELK